MPLATLKALSVRLTTVPDGFKLHSRVEKVIADRRAMGEGKQPLDWGMGETLAYATLLDDGYGVRLSGEDIGRGTFSHRHAVLHDQKRERWDTGAYVPLQHLKDKQPTCEIIDSVLTEQAVVAFEYGYSTSDPTRLVVWEAQFGDFVNGAQVVIDQFISAGEVKWGRICGLVMLLPHGYEGQGPEHSSARPERFLQLCAQHNMQVCVPTTPAQVFHMLRRQMLRKFRKPLIVMSPKSLLRHKEAVSSLDDLANGGFQTVIGETEKLAAKNIRRVHRVLGQGVLRAARAPPGDRRSTTSRSSGSSSSTRFRTPSSRPRSRASPTRRKWCGCRKSRRTRARGTGCARTCAPTFPTSRCWRTPAGRSRRRRRSATRRSTTPNRSS